VKAKGRTSEEWEELLKDYYESGLDQKDWCNKKEINLSTFRFRMSRMKRRKNPAYKAKNSKKGNSKEIPFIKICTKSKSVLKDTEESIEIKINEFSININSDFNEIFFSKVCKVLKDIC
jgi:hypothetical protein